MHRLYYSPGACSMAVHIVLEEIGESYETELVSSVNGLMTQTDGWRTKNPKGRIPALSDVPGKIGGAIDLLTEAHAILLYLADTHPSAGLAPTDPAGRARCAEWMNWLSSQVHGLCYGLIWRPQRFSDDERMFPVLLQKGEQNVRREYNYIEGLLADGRDWAVPGGYSVVDPYLLVFYRWGQVIGLDMPANYPAWAGLARATVARPAVQSVLAKENIAIF